MKNFTALRKDDLLIQINKDTGKIERPNETNGVLSLKKRRQISQKETYKITFKLSGSKRDFYKVTVDVSWSALNVTMSFTRKPSCAE